MYVAKTLHFHAAWWIEFNNFLSKIEQVLLVLCFCTTFVVVMTRRIPLHSLTSDTCTFVKILVENLFVTITIFALYRKCFSLIAYTYIYWSLISNAHINYTIWACSKNRNQLIVFDETLTRLQMRVRMVFTQTWPNQVKMIE